MMVKQIFLLLVALKQILTQCEIKQAAVQYFYPVVNEYFQFNLSSVFDGDNMKFSYSYSSSILLDFEIISFASKSNGHQNFGGYDLIDMAQQEMAENVFAPTGFYVYLASSSSSSTTDPQYTIFGGNMSTRGDLTIDKISNPFGAQNTICTNIDIAGNVIIVTCTTIDQTSNNATQSFFYGYYNNNGSLISMSEKQVGSLNFAQSTINSSQTQMIQFFNSTTLYFGLWYSLIDAIPDQTNSFYFVIYTVSLNENNQPSFSVLQRYNFSDYTDFYITSDYNLFLLDFKLGLSIQGIFTGQLIASNISPFSTADGQYIGFGVYELQNQVTEQTYFVAISNPSQIALYQITPQTNSNAQVLIYAVYKTVYSANSLINFNIYLSYNFMIVVNSYSVTSFPSIGFNGNYQNVLWQESFSNLQTTSYDFRANVMILGLSNLQYSIQFTDAYIFGIPLVAGNFSLAIHATSGNKICSSTILFCVLNSSIGNEIYQNYGQNSTQMFYVTSNYPVPGYKQLNQLYTGPALNFTAQVTNQTAHATVQQWANLSYTADVIFAKIFNMGYQNKNYSQIIQFSNNTVIYYICNEPPNGCIILGIMDDVKFTIKQLELSFADYPEQLPLAFTLQEQPNIILVYNNFDQPVWSFVDQINVTNGDVSSFLFLQNSLYVNLENPYRLLVYTITNKSNVFLQANFSAPVYTPRQIFTNEVFYGPVLFIDNIDSLIIIRNVAQSQFYLENQINYSQNEINQSIGIGLLLEGVYIAYRFPNGTSLLQYIPRLGIYSISVALNIVPLNIPTYGFNFSTTTDDNQVIFTSSGSKFYIVAQNGTSYVVLVYDSCQTPYNAFYTYYELDYLPNYFQAINAPFSNIIALIDNNGGLHQILLQSSALLILTTVSQETYQQTGNIQIFTSIPTSNTIDQAVNLTYQSILSNLAIQVQNQPLTAQKLNSVWKINPQSFVSGSVVSYTGSCNGKGCQSVSVQTNVYKNRTLNGIIEPTAFTMSQDQVYMQNNSGVYTFLQNGESNLYYLFQSTSIQSCPVLFVDIFSGKFVSLCNLINTKVVAQIFDPSVNIYSNQTFNFYSVSEGSYKNGVLQLFNDSGQCSFFVDLKSQPYFQQLGCYEFLNFAFSYDAFYIDIPDHYNILDTINFSYGFSVISGQNLILVQQNVSGFIIDTNLIFNSTQQNITVNVTAVLPNLSPSSYYIQFFQINSPTQTETEYTVPFLFTTESQNFQIDMIFNQDYSFNRSVVNCPYATYGSYLQMPYGTAVDGIIAIPFSSSDNSNQTIGIYSSNNTLFGGQKSVCTSNTEAVTLLGGYEHVFLANASSTFLYQIFNNGQLFGLNQNTLQTLILNYQPFIQINAQFNKQNRYPQIEIESSNYLYVQSTFIQINSDAYYTLSSWTIAAICVGSVLGVSIIILLVCLYRRRKMKMDQSQQKEEEYTALQEIN